MQKAIGTVAMQGFTEGAWGRFQHTGTMEASTNKNATSAFWSLQKQKSAKLFQVPSIHDDPQG